MSEKSSTVTSPVSSTPSRANTIPTRSNTLATRTTTGGSMEEDAVTNEDTSEVTKLFHERLQAWRHAVVYLEDYVTATEKMQTSHGKEYEKVLKTVSQPLKEGHHFDQSLGGIAGMFDNIRSNTQGVSNSHYEAAKTIKGSILPIFERLENEIKNKVKELTKGAGKASKAVDKAKNATQKHIELLGQHTATFDSTGGKIGPGDDPYVIRRGLLHRLNKQILEENNNRQDLIAVQQNFQQFESHVISTMQMGIGQFFQVVSSQAEQTKAMYSDMVATAQRIPPTFEWEGFLKRSDGVLIDPEAPPRSMSNVSFPNENHRSTEPMIAGSLERKGKVLKRYDTAYYVVTQAKYLHEYKTDDDYAKDPVPEMSLYLPDCLVGAINGDKFNVKGKDVSKGSVGNKFSMSHELAFKAHTAADAAQWWDIVRACAGQITNEQPHTPGSSTPASPAISTQKTGVETTSTSAAASPVVASEKEKEDTAASASVPAETETASPAATATSPVGKETASPVTAEKSPAKAPEKWPEAA